MPRSQAVQGPWPLTTHYSPVSEKSWSHGDPSSLSRPALGALTAPEGEPLPMSQTGDQGPDRQLTGVRPGFAHLRRPGPPRSSSAHPQRGPRCGQLGAWVSAVEQPGPEEPLMGAGRGAGTPAPSAAPCPGPPAPAVPLHPAPGARCPPVQGGRGVWTLSTCGQWPKPVSQVSQGPCGTAWRGSVCCRPRGVSEPAKAGGWGTALPSSDTPH